MCREVSDNQRLEHRLSELEKNVDVSEAVRDFAEEKMREQLELLEERVVELEKELLEKQDFRHIPQKNRLKLVADQRKEQGSANGAEELISLEK